MDDYILKLAARIIEGCDREHPADAVLRLQLKAQRELSARQAGNISRAVFAYFRWFGWLDQSKSVMEQIARAGELAERFSNNPASFSDPEIIAQAVPAWLGEQMEITAAWARSLQGEPKLWLRARSGQGRALAAKLARDFGALDCHVVGEGPLSDALEFRGETDLFRTPEFHAGEFEVQDLSSQAVGVICDPRPGHTWWDACAGEGGKLLHLSDLMRNQGLIWATDRAEWRLKRLKRRTARARMFNYRTRLWDGGAKLPTKTQFDGVLVDAPCSGVGTWHRNPQARWTTTLQDVEELGELQTSLLAHAAAGVKPGGKLVYAVCTLTRSETITVAGRFEEQFKQFTPFTVINPLNGAEAQTARITLRPETHQGNGMFVAVWQRKRQ